MEGAPRQGLGSFFRGLMDFVDERGLREQVRVGVSAATRAAIDDPPRVLSFIPSTPIDDIESVLQKLVGDDGLAECGIACARPLGWTMLQPIIRMAFMVFGQSPEPIFANLDRFFSMVTRGITFSWQSGDKGGSVLTRFAGEGPPEAGLPCATRHLAVCLRTVGNGGRGGTAAGSGIDARRCNCALRR